MLHTSIYLCTVYFIIIISFISLALKGIHKRLGLYKVLTHSQGNLEAKGEPRGTNTGQIKYRKINNLRTSRLDCSWNHRLPGGWPGATLGGQACLAMHGEQIAMYAWCK